jgi:hypothetical protein
MSKINIDYSKVPTIDLKHLETMFHPTTEDDEHQYNPFRIQKLQKYQPIYSLFFEMTENNYSAISLKHRFHMRDLEKVLDLSCNKVARLPVFIKYSPLYDPIKYMVGKYQNTNYEPFFYELPTINSNETNCNKKVLSVNNSAYTDGFFSYLSSQLLNFHGFVNGIDYYGSYLGIQEKFKINIEDDYEYLNNSTFFNGNIKKLFDVTQSESMQFMNYNSRGNKHKLNISSSQLDLDNEIITIQTLPIDTPVEIPNTNELAAEMIYQTDKSAVDKQHHDSDSSDSDESCTTGSDDLVNQDFDTHSDIGEDDHDESEEEESDEEEEGESDTSDTVMFAYIHNFPIQLICLEKCDGTLDALFENNLLNDEESIAALFQIIMTLVAYQKAYHFTHNDLHTNNIVYKQTKTTHLYYRYKKVMYRVPTYGRIFKIIDFGRSIYKYNGHLFCSDSFAPGGDASTQYNFEPFYDDKKPMLPPNYSFDLCRLGTSIFDFVLDIDHMTAEEDMTQIQRIIASWCTDDLGKNILYKKNGEERYPNFKLYKMIARTVHNHLPEKQLELPAFKRYEYDTKKKYQFDRVINLDKIPCYV